MSAPAVVTAPTAHIAAWSNTHKMHEVEHAIRIYQTCIDIAAIATLMERPAVTHVISSNSFCLLQQQQH